MLKEESNQGSQSHLAESQVLRRELVEHVIGAGGPSQALLDHGVFPANWVARYLGLLDRAVTLWKGAEVWPRDVVGAIHFASFYLNIRYEAWRHGSGDRNVTTERLLGQIRMLSEMFLLAGVTSRCWLKEGEKGTLHHGEPVKAPINLKPGGGPLSAT